MDVSLFTLVPLYSQACGFMRLDSYTVKVILHKLWEWRGEQLPQKFRDELDRLGISKLFFVLASSDSSQMLFVCYDHDVHCVMHCCLVQSGGKGR